MTELDQVESRHDTPQHLRGPQLLARSSTRGCRRAVDAAHHPRRVFRGTPVRDLASQLKIPRAVLADRLKSLVQEGVLIRDDDAAGGVEYRLTAKGVALWPVVRTLMSWGDAFYSPSGAKRTVRHDQDGGLLDHEGRCQDCGLAVPVPEIRIEPGPGFDLTDAGSDLLSSAIQSPRRLLEPIRAPRTREAGEGGLSPTRASGPADSRAPRSA